MGNRPVAYWILLVVAIVAAAAAMKIGVSADPHTKEIAKYIGYGAIALLLIARFFFRSKPQPTPPMPKD